MELDPTEKIEITRIEEKEKETVRDPVIVEHPITIKTNDQTIAKLVCTPENIEELGIGYLHSENIIKSYEDIEEIQINRNEVKVETREEKIEESEIKTITSGCGKGNFKINPESNIEPLKCKNIEITPHQIYGNVKELHNQSELFKKTGGVHNALLTDGDGEKIVFRDDIGRHNAVDKIIGHMIRNKIQTGILTISGRISVEILLKAARRKIPIIASRSAPTNLAVQIAHKLNITLIGFIRNQRMNIYTHQKRINQETSRLENITEIQN